MKEQRNKTTKRNMMLVMVAMLLVISLVGGTMAWLTIRDSLSNSFTVVVGKVTDPEVPEDDDEENGKTQPEDPKNPYEVALSGNIYEPSFDPSADNNISLGTLVEKDPYIGLGAGSESSYVFAWWDDNTQYYASAADANAQTPVVKEGAFNIEPADSTEDGVLTEVDGYWKPVDGTSAGTDGTSALYVWCNAGGKPVALETSTDATVWTDVLFKKGQIEVKSDIYQLVENAEGDTVDVYCFIHQATDGNGDELNYDDIVLPAAKEAYTSSSN